MSFKQLLLLPLALLVFTPAPSWAEEVESKNKKSMEKIEEEMRIANRARRKATEDALDIMEAVKKDLEPREKNHLFITYSNYNIIETVRTVQGDVSNAITQCGKNNPDMKEGLDKRFKAWNGQVNPLLEEATGNLNNMVLAQDYTSKEKIDEIFAAVDKARELSNSQIEKIPVTTPEACKYLQEKMDDTQESMTGLLRATLVSYPKSFSKSPEEVYGGKPEKKDDKKSDETNT